MKRLFLCISICLFCENINSQSCTNYSLLYCLDHMDVMLYPYCEGWESPLIKRCFPLPKEYWGDLPTFCYKDMGENEKMHPSWTEALFRRRLIPTNGNYYLVSCQVGIPDSWRRLLITYDVHGKVIDWLEVGIYFPATYLKQWCITSNMHIAVYHLKLDTKHTHLAKADKDKLFTGQRTDSFYWVDATGKFHFLSEVKYRPEKYSGEYLEGRHNVWDGGEEPIN